MTYRATSRVLAILLCVLMALPALPQSSGGSSQLAGQVNGFNAGVTINGVPAKLKQDIFWNNTLKTDHSGRLRIGLRDGSILSLGSETEVKIVAHDPAAQLTELELSSGRLRSRVVKVRPGGKFQIRTPRATANVVGTDFYLGVQTNGNVQLIVYSGRVQMNGTGKFQGQTVAVDGGQMVEINANGFASVQPTPYPIQQDTIAATSSEASTAGSTAAAAGSNTLRNVLIGVGVAAAGVAVAAIKNSGQNSSSSTSTSAAAATAGTSKSTSGAASTTQPPH